LISGGSFFFPGSTFGHCLFLSLQLPPQPIQKRRNFSATTGHAESPYMNSGWLRVKNSSTLDRKNIASRFVSGKLIFIGGTETVSARFYQE
jgi:hypothetical protein